MKTRVICMGIALLSLVTSCTNEELVNPNPEGATPTPGQQVTITATLPGSGNDADKPGTRMGYDENADAAVGGLLTHWTTGDAFNILPYNGDTGAEGDPQTFTLDAASAGKNEGTFTGTAPAASSEYAIYYPAGKIKNSADFSAFAYAGQVQKGNGNRDHLTAYHSIRLGTEADYTKIDFSDCYQSSCMKFVLTLPGDEEIVPKTITLATAKGRESFYATNRGDGSVGKGDIASLSMEVEDITLTGTEHTITAYMMMSCQEVGLESSEGLTVTVDAEDGSSYSQSINTADGYQYLVLESGKMHTLTAKNMTKVELPSMTFKVKVTSVSNTFSIPFPTSGTTPAAMTVTWGDGGKAVEIPAGTTLTSEADDAFNHTYTSAAAEGTEYTITITSAQTDATQKQIPDFNFYYNRPNNNSNQKKLISMDTPLLNTGATNFSDCFNKCTALATIPAVLFDNNKEAIDFDYCFGSCKVLEEIPAALFASNTKAKDFNHCFYGCTKLNTIYKELFDNNPEATSFEYCFYSCSALKEIPVALFDNNPEATSFEYCFSHCGALEEIPVALFDKNTKAEKFGGCFNSCGKLATIPEELFANNLAATNFIYCFKDCYLAKLNAKIFSVEGNTNPETNTRFSGKTMNFTSCFMNTGGSLTDVDASIAPQLWKYDKGGATWTTTDCFQNCKASNSSWTDDMDQTAWGTHQ